MYKDNVEQKLIENSLALHSSHIYIVVIAVKKRKPNCNISKKKLKLWRNQKKLIHLVAISKDVRQ
jgi:hypothetical protein